MQAQEEGHALCCEHGALRHEARLSDLTNGGIESRRWIQVHQAEDAVHVGPYFMLVYDGESELLRPGKKGAESFWMLQAPAVDGFAEP